MYNKILIYIVKILLSLIKRDKYFDKKDNIEMRKKGFNMIDYDWIDIDILKVDIVDLEYTFTPSQLHFKLMELPYTSDMDILLENMMEYLLDEEMYEYCTPVNSEIEHRLLIRHLNKLDN